MDITKRFYKAKKPKGNFTLHSISPDAQGNNHYKLKWNQFIFSVVTAFNAAYKNST